MKSFSVIAAASLLLNAVNGHYIFQQLTANGVKGAVYQNIRKNTNNNSPVTDLADKDLRCNVGGGSSGGTTTVSVAAGSSFSFTSDIAVYHQGPVSFYLSKVADAAASDGSGDWFKFKEIGPKFPGGTWDLSTTYSANIPSCIPAGDYLLRIEQLAIHNPGSTPQFYISCAQIKVTGGGSKTFSGVKIPGHVKASDPGYTANIYNNFNSYTVPGPAPVSC
ncbi:lytic polysaccharide monooxygenase [Aaosphaeria arxii CBS 175.79]|uniref:AA9 family lytic polysaccharide monooxygenase n=1 Tax=Aaosphaeria arxii CBS 175.79 TaxID=1450172 RepID=A0A6A5XR27_9PLEO|nr:lytic polysaccharide monooxygenase [Aaosphaeria arxii CBS 175.79]KAF2015211.1 lytic polysaccharide monooxygenase [Aaosphaeria arxii CBS 175.79]